MRHQTWFSFLVTALIVMLPPASVSAAPRSDASIAGSIVHSADQSPLAGVKLHASDPKSGEIFSSAPTRSDGSFSIDRLPAATYQLAVESEGGLYVVGTPLPLEQGIERTIHVAVTPGVNTESGGAPADGSLQNVFDNPLGATAIFLGTAVVIGLLLDDDDDSADSNVISPSAPPL